MHQFHLKKEKVIMWPVKIEIFVIKTPKKCQEHMLSITAWCYKSVHIIVSDKCFEKLCEGKVKWKLNP